MMPLAGRVSPFERDSNKLAWVQMFGGKGGVGKTTCAAAAALHYAQIGEHTIIISTDPTPSLSHIFEVAPGPKPARVLENLDLMELGMDEVKEMWDRKFGREVYAVFSSFVGIEYEEFVDFVTSILPGLRDEFMVDYIKELSQAGSYDRVVWDTAPLGQTLGLLRMPSLLRAHLRPAPRIYSRLKVPESAKRSVYDILRGWEELSAEDMEFLREDVSFALVTIPEALAVQQLAENFGEFEEHGFRVGQLIINHVVKEVDSDFLRMKSQQQRGYIQLLHDRYQALDIIEVPEFPYEIKGIDRLREIARVLFS